MYRIFISHSWKYGSHYESLCGFLNQELGSFYDHSVSKNDPIHRCGTDKELYNAIEARIKGCSCVVILAGVYSSYSKWINKEIEIAKIYNKPIIAVEYWGAEHTSAIVKDNATTVVKWQAKSIAGAVVKYSIN